MILLNIPSLMVILFTIISNVIIKIIDIPDKQTPICYVAYMTMPIIIFVNILFSPI